MEMRKFAKIKSRYEPRTVRKRIFCGFCWMKHKNSWNVFLINVQFVFTDFSIGFNSGTFSAQRRAEKDTKLTFISRNSFSLIVSFVRGRSGLVRQWMASLRRLVLVNAILSFAFAKPCTTKLGLSGTCESITECDYAMGLLNSGDISDLTSCDFDGTVGVFCCPKDYSNSTSHLNKSCQKLLNLKDQLLPNIVPHSENSTMISVGEFPHMAQVMLPERGFVGSGALVSEKFVLTAAHIVYARRSLPTVRLGKVNKAINWLELNFITQQTEFNFRLHSTTETMQSALTLMSK